MASGNMADEQRLHSMHGRSPLTSHRVKCWLLEASGARVKRKRCPDWGSSLSTTLMVWISWGEARSKKKEEVQTQMAQDYKNQGQQMQNPKETVMGVKQSPLNVRGLILPPWVKASAGGLWSHSSPHGFLLLLWTYILPCCPGFYFSPTNRLFYKHTLRMGYKTALSYTSKVAWKWHVSYICLAPKSSRLSRFVPFVWGHCAGI